MSCVLDEIPMTTNCPDGFRYMQGDVANVSLKIAGKMTMAACAEECVEDIQCFSFVHSHTQMTCNLNKEMEPNARDHKESTFCSKDGMIK